MPQQYVTLVAAGGTPVRLANQQGAPFPTTGTGPLVFGNGPTLTDPIISGGTLSNVTLTDPTITIDNLTLKQLTLNDQYPGVTFIANTAAANQKVWNLFGAPDNGGAFFVQAVQDNFVTIQSEWRFDRATGGLTLGSETAIPAGGSQDFAYLFTTTSHFGVTVGSGAPTLSMAKGSFYLDNSGGVPYYNTDGATGWSPVATGAATLAVGVTGISGGAASNVLIDSGGTLNELAYTDLATASTIARRDVSGGLVAVSLTMALGGVLNWSTAIAVSRVSGAILSIGATAGATDGGLYTKTFGVDASGGVFFGSVGAASPDAGLSRLSAGLIGVGSGAAGSSAGSLQMLGATLLSTDAGAALGPVLELYRDSASPAASDIMGGVNFTGRSDAATKRTYASIQASIVDATNAAEDGQIDFFVMKGGTLSSAGHFTSTLIGTTGSILRVGPADSAAPVAALIEAPSITSGTADQLGSTLSINGGKGTGSGAGGSINFFVAPPGGSGTAVNGLQGVLSLTGGGGATHGEVNVQGAFTTAPGATLSGTSGTMASNASHVTINPSGNFTLTLPSPTIANSGRWLFIRNIVAHTVDSASANVVPVSGTAAGTPILAGVGWCLLQSNATNWVIYAAG